jgi:hypothetical protein
VAAGAFGTQAETHTHTETAETAIIDVSDHAQNCNAYISNTAQTAQRTQKSGQMYEPRLPP